MTTYELRTGSGRPFMAFDTKHRAIEYREAHLKRTKAMLRLFEVRRVEEDLAA